MCFFAFLSATWTLPELKKILSFAILRFGKDSDHRILAFLGSLWLNVDSNPRGHVEILDLSTNISSILGIEILDSYQMLSKTQKLFPGTK